MAALYARVKGAWTAAAKVWKKAGGVWAEQADPSAAVEDGARYESYAKTVNVTGSGNTTYCYVTINGTKHTAATAISVDKGTTVQCYAGRALVGSGYIYVNGKSVTAPSYAYTVTENCTIDLSYTNNGTYLRWGTIKITTP